MTPMTPEEKQDLEQLALLVAVEKANALRTIRQLLYSAINQVRSYEKCQNTWEVDPDLTKVRKDIQALLETVPCYDDLILASTAGFSAEKYEYFTGNDILRLRDKDRIARGTFVEDRDPGEYPFEDPLEVFRRMRAAL